VILDGMLGNLTTVCAAEDVIQALDLRTKEQKEQKK